MCADVTDFHTLSTEKEIHVFMSLCVQVLSS